MQPCPRRAYFVRTRVASSGPLELNWWEKGPGPLEPPCAAEEDWVAVASGSLAVDGGWAGPTAAGEDPAVWGRGKWKGSEGRQSVRERKGDGEKGNQRGMNVAKLQCDAMHAVHMRDFRSMGEGKASSR